MEQNNKYIEDLLEKFFEGLTSNNEEQILYRYFSDEKNIPEHLKKYKSMLQYFEDDMGAELDEVLTCDISVVRDVNDKNNMPLRKWMIGISAVAASLLLLFFVGPFTNSDDFNPYEGSYVKRDGVTVYDRANIEEEQARIELFVEQKLACLDNSFQQAKAKLKEYEDLEVQMSEITRKANKTK